MAQHGPDDHTLPKDRNGTSDILTMRPGSSSSPGFIFSCMNPQNFQLQTSDMITPCMNQPDGSYKDHMHYSS